MGTLCSPEQITPKILLDLIMEFEQEVVKNNPHYVDADFDFQNFTNWLRNNTDILITK